MRYKGWFDEISCALKKIDCTVRFKTVDVSIGPNALRIKVQKNTDFERFKRAFYCVNPASDDESPSLVVYCFDAQSIGSLPSPPWKYSELDHFGNFNSNGSNYYLHVDVENSGLIAMDVASGWGIFYMNESARMPSWHIYSPLKELIHLWCLSRNMLLLHAGSVIDRFGNASLLLGKGGTGKSTMTMQALALGLKSCGDDYVVVDVNKMQLYALYRTLKWKDNSAVVRPDYLNEFHSVWDQRAQKSVFYAPHTDEKVTGCADLVSLLVLQRGEGIRVSKLSFCEAITGVAFSSIAQSPAAASRFMTLVRQLLQQIAAWHYCIGFGAQDLIDAIEKVNFGLLKECAV